MSRLTWAIRGGAALAALWVSLSGAVAQQATAVPRERTLLFVGDVMLSRGVGAKMKAEGDWTYPFQKIAATLTAADLTFGNLECPVSDVGRDRYHLYSFRADPGAIEGLKYAGFDVMSVANNHMYDWGPSALLDTLQRLREAGIMPVGAGANDLEAHYPQLLNCAGLKLAFLAYVNVAPETAIAAPDRPGVAWLELDRVLADIRFARPLADVLVVALHWGGEYVTQPQRNQVELAHRMIDAGADLVVGSHAHVVQPVEEYRGRWIAYSLGNFVFDQRGPGTRRGAMLKVKLVEKQITEVTSVPITINGMFQAVLTPPEELAREALRASRKSKAHTIRAQ
jgi:poly-gamma-glutamate capsule biosynthesis protein CapA/YwtB (metallophosphatase superfamily)